MILRPGIDQSLSASNRGWWPAEFPMSIRNNGAGWLPGGAQSQELVRRILAR